MSRIQASGFGTTGAAFLYFEALNRHAIVMRLFFPKTYSYTKHDLKYLKGWAYTYNNISGMIIFNISSYFL
jgi:hypothetical protein